MALRSVVLAPPPGAGAPRRTVVLRPGAPKDKGRLADILAAVFGALLLIVAVVLVAILPDKEYATPQFRVTFPDTVDDFTFPTQKAVLNETEQLHIHEFKYELPDNVASINIRAEFTDDVTHSDPDQFRIEVFDPAGNPVGTRMDAINEPPKPIGDPVNDPTNYSQFEFDSFSQTFNLPTGEHPTEQIVGGLTHTEDRAQVLARLAPQYHLPTGGTWTVRVTLVQANNCPEPPAADVFQVTKCRAERSNGEDGGNEFAVAGFIYTFYTPCVEQLGKASAGPLCATQP